MKKFELSPRGLFEPVVCSKSKCMPTKNLTINGNRKWNPKKRFKVGLSTANPPHNQVTMSPPTRGIAEKSLVITVAPQKDICPQGRTYPRNAVAITSRRITTPIIHVPLKKYDPKNRPRATCA